MTTPRWLAVVLTPLTLAALGWVYAVLLARAVSSDETGRGR